MSKALIVDSSNLHRKGIGLLLNETHLFEAIQDFENLLLARRQSNSLRPELVVVNHHNFSVESSEELKGFIHETNLPVILIGSPSWLVAVQELFSSGLKGVVCNLSTPGELHRAVRCVVQKKEMYVCPNFGKYILEQMVNVDGKAYGDSVLSKREIQVISLIFKDYSESEMAEQLSISPSTVKSHKERIYSKLGIHSKVELIHFCYRNNLVS